MGVIQRYYIRDAETNELWCIPADYFGYIASSTRMAMVAKSAKSPS